jgi:transcriptional regulator with XRE-family HTH domain
VPKISTEDRQFASRLGSVLRELRAAAGWTQEEAAEKIKVPLSTLGRWERGTHAPKGYDLGRLYRAYKRVGAEWEWFFDPPAIVVVNPVRDRLAQRGERRSEAAALAREDLEGAQVKHRAVAARQSAQRRRRPA